jgi:acetoin utilization protein AcuB
MASGALDGSTRGIVHVGPVVTVDWNTPCDTVDELFQQLGIRHLPVTKERRLVGVIGRHDLMRSALAFALGHGEHGRIKLLHSLPVKEVMREEVITVQSGQLASEAARLLLDHRIGSLPVLEGGELVGIVTSSDFLRTLATTSCSLSSVAAR